MSPAEAVALAKRLLAVLPERRDDAIAVLNGLLGDSLAEADSPLALSLELFEGPSLRPVTELATVDPGPHPCLLVHGLMGNERAWSFGVGEGERIEYGQALADLRGVTPIYVRYNTGLHVSINGRSLAERLEALNRERPLRDLSVVAHSMGGLVMRSACHYGLEAGHGWVQQLERVFLLGVPSHGAALEQLVHVAAFTLESIWNPWTKLIGKVINLRSAGIKDLRHGFVLDEDWRNRDPDELALRAPRPAQMPEQVRWFVAEGTLGPQLSTGAKILGDGLVGRYSARGKGFGTPEPGLLPDAKRRTFERTSHVALMNDPRVLQQIAQWWAEDAD